MNRTNKLQKITRFGVETQRTLFFLKVHGEREKRNEKSTAKAAKLAPWSHPSCGTRNPRQHCCVESFCPPMVPKQYQHWCLSPHVSKMLLPPFSKTDDKHPQNKQKGMQSFRLHHSFLFFSIRTIKKNASFPTSLLEKI